MLHRTVPAALLTEPVFPPRYCRIGSAVHMLCAGGGTLGIDQGHPSTKHETLILLMVAGVLARFEDVHHW